MALDWTINRNAAGGWIADLQLQDSILDFATGYLFRAVWEAGATYAEKRTFTGPCNPPFSGFPAGEGRVVDGLVDPPQFDVL